jgi:hypothetical protein
VGNPTPENSLAAAEERPIPGEPAPHELQPNIGGQEEDYAREAADSDGYVVIDGDDMY